MRWTWRTSNRILYVASLTVALACAVLIPYAMHRLESTTDQTQPTVKTSSVVAEKKAMTLPPPTEDMLAMAASIPLQRMNPPLPEPAPPPMPVVTTPFNIDTKIFDGELIGTIVDTDPSHSCALVNMPGNRVLLVALGMPITNEPSSPLVSEIREDEIVLTKGTQTQTAKVRGGPKPP